MLNKKVSTIAATLLLSLSVVGCATVQGEDIDVMETTSVESIAVETTTAETTTTETTTVDASSTEGLAETSTETSTTYVAVENSILDTEEIFTNRDLEQSADLTQAITIDLVSGEEVTINEEGIYVLSGDVTEVTVIVEADDEAKVQLVLDGLSIVNTDAPGIYVKSGDKVFVTTTDSENSIEVSGDYSPDGDTNLDAAIYSKSDLVLNGIGTLEIVSTNGNGITSKDDLKVTGGTYLITSMDDGLEANDSISVYDGNISIVSNKDAIHSENDDDSSLGTIYIQNGTINIASSDDAIRGTSLIQIDGGDINIETCTEGIEATYIQINGGEIDIYATDDGINATAKSDYDVAIEVNGGTITVVMASGDTDGFDANGDIYINGGTISIDGGSTFDANGTVQLNGGEVILNGELVTDASQISSGRTKGTKNRN